ncbi:hypothetical protein KIN20_027412 [Parelaphostrongylus tenuis]|uniref:Uncharacterized protein n=1 Tax=Parelaphostrongylus tenuis TaxID=148309 RepID=A0AAD5QZC5_PARTN|nr:hypothetical protein KIN20_027412 [Parelaphostrongylus tenuis]
MAPNLKKEICLIADNTVTGICTVMARAMTVYRSRNGENRQCSRNSLDNWRNSFGPSFILFRTFSFCEEYTVQTTNIIMANWSRAIWQSVLDRAARLLASGHLNIGILSQKMEYRPRSITKIKCFLYIQDPDSRVYESESDSQSMSQLAPATRFGHFFMGERVHF